MGLDTITLALGLVLIFEGLVFALAPRRLEDILEMLAALSPETRRVIGLLALVIGAGLVTLSGLLGG